MENSQFESLLPLVVEWAQQQENRILAEGVSLSPEEVDDAQQLGVQHLERVRLLQVAEVPMPQDAVLRAAAQQAGLVSPGTIGMALRYGIFIRRDCWRQRAIIAHELVHTAQYERLGGFEAFLRSYLTECLRDGYENSPLECEARIEAENLLRQG